MNALLKAIFGHDAERVRELAVSHPELLSQRSESGSLPFDLARSAGYVRAAAVLLRLGAPGTDRVKDHDALLESYLCDLSYSHACAGWLNGVEFIVWCICEGDTLPIDDTHEFMRLPKTQLEDIKYLSAKCQAWPHWDAREGGVRMVSLTRWQHLYREWREGTSSASA